MEEIRWLRDEMANPAWAVPHTATDALGEGRPVGELEAHAPPTATARAASVEGEPTARYVVQTDVPSWWVPLVPTRPTGGHRVTLRVGTFATSAQTTSPPRGRMFPQAVDEAEVPRVGVTLTRVRVASRWIDGPLHAWTQRVRPVRASAPRLISPPPIWISRNPFWISRRDPGFRSATAPSAPTAPRRNRDPTPPTVLPSAIVLTASPDVLRALPPAHAVLASTEALALAASLSRDALRDLVRDVIDSLRDDLLAARITGSRDDLAREAAARLPAAAAARRRTPRLRRVINATGVVLHTNLGRAPLSDVVLAEVAEACRGYATLEYDLAAGRRGHRDALVAPLLAAVLGADDAAVVNNCAAAVLLAVTAFAQGREVLVSRGQLVEIGGGFRIPDVIASCGARLVEVGTTNRTRVADYERAITPQTAAILEVHRSNFALVGFTESADVAALAALSRARGLAMLEDLGSGAMVDTAAYGLPRERTARDAIADGVDLVMVSGDKLLGGPQAGILAGRSEAVAKVRRHPLMRALRPGRLVLAALEATMRAYAEGRATRDVAAVATLAQPEGVVEARARGLAAAVLKQLPDGSPGEVTVVRAEGQVGGGTLPTATVASWAVRVRGIDATTWERRLRAGDPPVVARIKDGALLLDARTIRDDEVLPAATAVAAAWREREMADGEAADDDTE